MRFIRAIFNRTVTRLVNLFFLVYFRYKDNPKKKNILIYTDSRGFLVNCVLCNKTPYKSYIAKLSKDYNITYKLCPHKHTTIIDFLNYLSNKNIEKFDIIILHLGIVDFSPRPISQFDAVYSKKSAIVKKLFHNVKIKPNYYNVLYENQQTFSLYDLDSLKIILNKLVEISKKVPILWIGMNKVDINWNGNYFKKRPRNINKILEYQNYIEQYLKENRIDTINYINIDKLDGFELKKHTVDNMHLTEEGFHFFYNMIINKLNK